MVSHLPFRIANPRLQLESWIHRCSFMSPECLSLSFIVGVGMKGGREPGGIAESRALRAKRPKPTFLSTPLEVLIIVNGKGIFS